MDQTPYPYSPFRNFKTCLERIIAEGCGQWPDQVNIFVLDELNWTENKQAKYSFQLLGLVNKHGQFSDVLLRTIRNCSPVSLYDHLIKEVYPDCWYWGDDQEKYSLDLAGLQQFFHSDRLNESTQRSQYTFFRNLFLEAGGILHDSVPTPRHVKPYRKGVAEDDIEVGEDPVVDEEAFEEVTLPQPSPKPTKSCRDAGEALPALIQTFVSELPVEGSTLNKQECHRLVHAFEGIVCMVYGTD